MKLKKLAVIAAAVIATAVAASPAMAAIDVSAATTALGTDGSDAIETVGSAMLTLSGIAVVFKWAKAAFFG